MDSPAFDGPRHRAHLPRFRWIHLLAALGVVLYGLLLARSMGAVAGGSDSSGYLNNARLLAEGRVTLSMRLVPGLQPDTLPPYTHVPLGFIPNPDHRTMTPTYPMGLHLLLLGVAQIVGWEHAPAWLMGLHALSGIGLVCLLGRKAGVDPEWALAGALLLAASPLYLFLSLQLMSDVPALVWVAAAVYFAWCSRDRAWLAVPAGAALGFAVLVRPTDLLALVPIAFALGLSLRRALGLVLGGLPCAVFLGVFNQVTYGRILTTGYGYVAPEFSLNVVPATMLHYAEWLPVLLTPVILLAAGLPALRPRRGFAVASLGAWMLVFLLFYVADVHMRALWWIQRYVLPAYPAMIVAALLVAASLVDRIRLPFRRWWPVALAVMAVVNGAVWSRQLHVLAVVRNERTYPLTTAWIQRHLPADAVVASMQASGALLYDTPLTFFRWDMIPPEAFERIGRACAQAGRPVYAVLFPFEIEDPNWAAFDKHLTGHWTQIGAVRQVTIWRYDSPAGK